MVLDIAVALIVLLLLTLGFIRGFIKEVLGLAGLALSIGATMARHDHFFDTFSARVPSEALAGVLSGGTVFVLSITCAILAGSIIVRLLEPLRHSVLDKTAGSIVGLAKGLVISYFLFFAMETLLYVFAPYPKSASGNDEAVENVELPGWFVDTYSYGVFSVASEYMGSTLSDGTYEQITLAARDLLDKKRSGRAMTLHKNHEEP